MDDKIAKALDLIGRYGGIDGDHHKQWVLDQVVRTLTDCEPVDVDALDCRGEHYTFQKLDESEAYKAWVAQWSDGEDGPDSYEWDVGIAP